MEFLDKIRSRQDLLKLDTAQTNTLCQEIRDCLVQTVAKNGGHLASNLGIVELTVAIQKVFDTTKDRVVFDVGHQSYVHKLLTGRYEQFSTLRQFGGIAGFPKPSESIHDAFVAGHASNAISVALGMARARTLQKADYSVIALLGDGAMTGGLFYEGLDDAGDSGEPLIVILNDNGMSITPNVGGIASHLSNIRIRPGYYRIKHAWRTVTGWNKFGRWIHKQVHRFKEWLKRKLIGSTVFDDMGFEYFGPVDGHDIKKVSYLLSRAKELKKPVVVHVLTQKGRGYQPAEENPDQFHGISGINLETGMPKCSGSISFSDTFGTTLTDLAKEDPRVCAITAAMQNGTGLDAFAAAHPNRFFDVGIAEGHAVSMAGGLAKQGMIPVVAIYSTFLQRAFDMILQDVSMMHSHVVFAVDRAGLVGNDGETHHGEFDVGYLRLIPGMTVLCPSNQAELDWMLRKAVLELDGPVAVRYPRGGDGRMTDICKSPVLREGSDVTLVTYGTLVNNVLDAADMLKKQGISAEVMKLGLIKPLDMQAVEASFRKTGKIFVIEEAASVGCVGNEIFRRLSEKNMHGTKIAMNLGDRFITHGTVNELYQMVGLDAASIAKRVTEVLA